METFVMNANVINNKTIVQNKPILLATLTSSYNLSIQPKFSLVLLIFITTQFSLWSQDIKKSVTKMEEFASRTGVIIKFTNHHLQDIKTVTGVAASKIRKVMSGGDIRYFHQISITKKYKSIKASIAYEDLLEILKALKALKNQAEVDINGNADYLENKFVTDDGVQLGYYVSEQKIGWYLVLEKYGSDNTLFFKKVNDIESALEEARLAIEAFK